MYSTTSPARPGPLTDACYNVEDGGHPVTSNTPGKDSRFRSTGSFVLKRTNSPNEEQPFTTRGSDNERESDSELDPLFYSPTCRLTEVDPELEIPNPCSASTDSEFPSLQSPIVEDNDNSDSGSYVSLLEDFELSSDGGRIMWVDGMKFEMISVPPPTRPTIVRSKYLSLNIGKLEHRVHDTDAPIPRRGYEDQVLAIPWARAAYAYSDVIASDASNAWPPTSEQDYIPTSPTLSEVEGYREKFGTLLQSNSGDQLEVDGTASDSAAVFI